MFRLVVALTALKTFWLPTVVITIAFPVVSL